MKKPLRFAYLSSVDPRNKKVWSGTHYSIYSGVSENLGEVEVLGPYTPTIPDLIGKIKNQLAIKILRKRFDYRHSLAFSKAMGRHFNSLLKNKSFDFIIAPAASSEIAFLKTEIPIIYVTDTTFKRSLNYHKALTNLTANSVKEGLEVEQKCIYNSDIVVVSSEWAKDSVKNDFNCDDKKILLTPFGANLEKINENAISSFEKPSAWKLLFMGVYWESKGGSIAFNCFKKLYDQGYNVELIVCGCIPPPEFKHEKMRVVPFLDKNNEKDREKIISIFKESHFLLLPTRFDCTPIVFCEASAFGIPCISSKTGGVEGHIKEGINGHLVDYTDDGMLFSQTIKRYMDDPDAYLKFRKSTQDLYRNFLNWPHWMKELQKKLTELFPEKTKGAFRREL